MSKSPGFSAFNQTLPLDRELGGGLWEEGASLGKKKRSCVNSPVSNSQGYHTGLEMTYTDRNWQEASHTWKQVFKKSAKMSFQPHITRVLSDWFQINVTHSFERHQVTLVTVVLKTSVYNVPDN